MNVGDKVVCIINFKERDNFIGTSPKQGVTYTIEYSYISTCNEQYFLLKELQTWNKVKNTRSSWWAKRFVPLEDWREAEEAVEELLEPVNI